MAREVVLGSEMVSENAVGKVPFAICAMEKSHTPLRS